MNEQFPGEKTDKRGSVASRFSRVGLVVILLLVAVLFVVMTKSPETPVRDASITPKAKLSSVTESSSPRIEGVAQPLTEAQVKKLAGEDEDPELKALIDQYPTLAPKPLDLTKKVLVSKKWNSGTDGFGLNKPAEGQEGDVIGPASVLHANDSTYVLDNVHNRILNYDKDGRLVSTANLPSTGLATDLVFNPNDSSIFVIDHYADKIHVVKGDDVTTLSVPLRESLIIGARFGYDASTGTLWAQDMENGGNVAVAVMQNGEVVDVDKRTSEILAPATVAHLGDKLIVTTQDGGAVTVPLDKTIECVEQVETDRNGVVWVLFTLEGDYQTYRVARVDLAKNTAGVAQVDVFFTYDGTRRMTATDEGVVFFTSDEAEGHVIAFNNRGAL
jgi:hypothetical protein